MEIPSETDKVWLYAGVIAYGYDIQSELHESEPP